MTTQALVVQEQQEIATQSPRGILTRETLRDAAEQRQLLAEYVKQQMIEGTDYGVIPGTKNKTLLKPGAEKLVELFRCTPKFALVKSTEDFDTGLFAYTFRVRLYQRDAEAVLAEGYGSANSREGRYRWRQASRKCPACEQEAIIKGKAEFGGGWLCYKKKDGCGAKYNDHDPLIVDQEVGRIENEDIASQANAILKVAKKRCLVDGAIALARVSDLFTQDMEDHGAVHEQGDAMHGADQQANSAPHGEAKPAAKPKGAAKTPAKPTMWQRIKDLADGYAYPCGENYADLRVAVKKITGKGRPSELMEEDFVNIEAAISATMKPKDDAEPPAQTEESDIPF